MTQRRPNKGASVAKVTRRLPGTPRRLLLEAAQSLFAERNYGSITTREIAKRAGVLEPVLFRQFGSKAGLFREAIVAPFVELVEAFNEEWPAMYAEGATDEAVGRQFLGSLYDLLVGNRGLLTSLLMADGFSEEELAETGLKEIGSALSIIAGIPAQPGELAARSSVAMAMGMAAFGGHLFRSRPPTRDEIVDELTQMTLHGFLHRP